MNRREIQRDATTLTTHGFLVIDAEGSLRLTATPPYLRANEIMMKLAIKVPRNIFTKPSLSAEITVPAEAGNPSVIEAKTVADMQEAVRQATGMELSITVVPPEGT
jgi:hypothetical protein